MTVVDLVIRNGHLVIPRFGTIDAGIAVDIGKIHSIATEANLPAADKVIDVGGKCV